MSLVAEYESWLGVAQPDTKQATITRHIKNARIFFMALTCGLTKKAEPPPTRDVNPVKVRGPTGLYARDSGTESANGGWLRRLVRHRRHI